MSDQANPSIPLLAKAQAPDGDVGVGRVFFDGLPAMAGVVTMIAQPFAQESLHKSLGLPDWFPVVVAIVVSGLLAAYKMFVVRHSGPRECAICVPILMLIIFSAYATGNNVVYYAKEGYTKAGSTAPTPEDVAAVKQERDILQQQLKSANELIDSLRQALNVPEGGPSKPRAWLPTFLGGLMRWGPADVYAQTPRQPAEARPPERVTVQQLREKLRQYEVQQQQLSKQLETVKREEKTVEAPQQRLIKSW
jgi:hypothetical protein